MISLDEMEVILDEAANELPSEIYKDLNGGILLLPGMKLNPVGKKNDLYIIKNIVIEASKA
jgi:hypothetical protein